MSEKGVLSKSIASNISEAIIEKLGGTGYAPTEWSKNINLLGIASADIEEALASITEDTSSSDKGLLSLSIASDVGAMLNKKYNTSRGFKPSEVSSAVSALTPLPEKTASSAPIVTFSDGSDDVPTKSLVVTIPPTLSGVSSVTETQTGRNLVDGTNFTRGLPSTTIGASIETITASTRYAYFGINIGGGNFTVSSVSSDTDYFNTILIYGYTNDILSVYTNASVNTSKTVDFSLCDYIRIAIATRSSSYQVPTDLTEYGTIQLEVGSTAHAYEAYQTPTVYTASLGRTIYGGQADIVNGTGKSEYGNIDMGTLTWQYDSANTRFFTVGLTGVIKRGTSGWITDLAVSSPYTVASGTANDKTISEHASTGYVYIKDTDYTDTATFKAFLSGKYLTYPLATPTDFTFTGQEINSRLGYNAFWSEQGDTEVTYRADIDLYEAPSMLLGANNTETEGNEEQEVNE